MTELDERLKKLDEDDLDRRWQEFRVLCLKLAVKIATISTAPISATGFNSPANIIEIAETLGDYILHGVKEEDEPAVEDAPQ